jgi:uncharacterized RDD family membrane protein YckC
MIEWILISFFNSMYHPPLSTTCCSSAMDSARLPRILAAIIYDIIIVFAIIFLAAQWFPYIPESLQSTLPVRLFKQVYMLSIGFIYFAYSWRRGGQTIGMKSWRIKLTQEKDQSPVISLQQCAIRYCVAIISWLTVGLGFLWIVLSKQHKSWHDHASSTCLCMVPKP